MEENMLGGNIRRIRMEKEISILELEKMAGVSRATIDILEHSRLKDVRLSTLQKIATALDVDIAELLQKK